MEAWLQHVVTQSLAFTLIVIMLVSFIESLAIVGLLLPGTVIMVSVGAFIGGGHIGFYSAWIAAVVGCLSGDWVSYFIGRAFKRPLHNVSFLQKHHKLLNKIEHALHQHNMITILFGRFIGPTRPLVPMMAGMLDLPPLKFVLPSIIGCLAWPPVYFFPGILAGVAVEIPQNANNFLFRWLLLSAVILFWLAMWLLWRWWCEGKHSPDYLSSWLPLTRLRWVTVATVIIALASFACLSLQPLMPVYLHLLWLVLAGQW